MHVLAAVVIVLSLSTSARANPEFLPEAIAFGAKDCLFCHTDPGGGRTWNDRGHWLMARKQESGQETVAVSWLEDYVGPSATETEPRGGVREGPSTGPRNVPETYHQGPFFEPVRNEAALQRWIDSRGKYTTAGGEWPQYSGDVASSKYSPLDQIHGENVTDLEVAWTWDAFDNSNYIKPEAPTNRQPTRAERAMVSRWFQGHAAHGRRQALHPHEFQRSGSHRSCDRCHSMDARSGNHCLGPSSHFRIRHSRTRLLERWRPSAHPTLHGR